MKTARTEEDAAITLPVGYAAVRLGRVVHRDKPPRLGQRRTVSIPALS